MSRPNLEASSAYTLSIKITLVLLEGLGELVDGSRDLDALLDDRAL